MLQDWIERIVTGAVVAICLCISYLGVSNFAHARRIHSSNRYRWSQSGLLVTFVNHDGYSRPGLTLVLGQPASEHNITRSRTRLLMRSFERCEKVMREDLAHDSLWPR
jgi:hypothetical protein